MKWNNAARDARSMRNPRWIYKLATQCAYIYIYLTNIFKIYNFQRCIQVVYNKSQVISFESQVKSQVLPAASNQISSLWMRTQSDCLFHLLNHQLTITSTRGYKLWKWHYKYLYFILQLINHLSINLLIYKLNCNKIYWFFWLTFL